MHIDYEAPQNPEISIDVDSLSTEQAARQVVDYLKKEVMSGKPRPAAVPESVSAPVPS
ncbi:MAG: hypothetical protein R2864_11085 [Syntrophotaleaceae bacterium]